MGTVAAKIQQWEVMNVPTGHSQRVAQGLWDTVEISGQRSSFLDLEMN